MFEVQIWDKLEFILEINRFRKLMCYLFMLNKFLQLNNPGPGFLFSSTENSIIEQITIIGIVMCLVMNIPHFLIYSSVFQVWIVSFVNFFILKLAEDLHFISWSKQLIHGQVLHYYFVLKGFIEHHFIDFFCRLFFQEVFLKAENRVKPLNCTSAIVQLKGEIMHQLNKFVAIFHFNGNEPQQFELKENSEFFSKFWIQFDLFVLGAELELTFYVFKAFYIECDLYSWRDNANSEKESAQSYQKGLALFLMENEEVISEEFQEMIQRKDLYFFEVFGKAIKDNVLIVPDLKYLGNLLVASADFNLLFQVLFSIPSQKISENVFVCKDKAQVVRLVLNFLLPFLVFLLFCGFWVEEPRMILLYKFVNLFQNVQCLFLVSSFVYQLHEIELVKLLQTVLDCQILHMILPYIFFAVENAIKLLMPNLVENVILSVQGFKDVVHFVGVFFVIFVFCLTLADRVPKISEGSNLLIFELDIFAFLNFLNDLLINVNHFLVCVLFQGKQILEGEDQQVLVSFGDGLGQNMVHLFCLDEYGFQSTPVRLGLIAVTALDFLQKKVRTSFIGIKLFTLENKIKTCVIASDKWKLFEYLGQLVIKFHKPYFLTLYKQRHCYDRRSGVVFQVGQRESLVIFTF